MMTHRPVIRRPRDCASAVRGRVGHRGAFLLFLAVLDTGIGYTLITIPDHHGTSVTGTSFHVLARLGTVLPLNAWGGLWLGVALACLIGAFQRSDRISYGCACFIKTAWAALYADLAITGRYPQGWLAALVWLSFAAITLMVSSWPEGGCTGKGAGRTPPAARERTPGGGGGP